MSDIINEVQPRTIPAGTLDVVPLPAVSIQGEATWDGKRLTIENYDVSELQKLKQYDALLINGEIAYVASPVTTMYTLAEIKLIPNYSFSSPFTAEAVRWSKGIGWSEYMHEWHVLGDDFELNGRPYGGAVSFMQIVLLQLVNAVNDVIVNPGIILTTSVTAIQPTNVTFIGNTTYNINNYNLSFFGAEVDGDLLVRDFDPFGNDIGGVKNTNVIGADNLFNSIRGADNTLGDDCRFNTVIGQNVAMGDDNGGSLIAATDANVGDSTSYIFIIGEQSNAASNSDFSSSIGIGHNISGDFQYYFGQWSNSINGGIAIGNGSSSLNRSNAFEALLDGSVKHSGAYANKPFRVTTGGSVVIPDNVSVYIYDPASIQAGATITLPANPIDGQDLYIIGGGTITSGNVITGFTLDGNGRTVIGDGAANLKVGKAYELHYVAANDTWYAIAF